MLPASTVSKESSRATIKRKREPNLHRSCQREGNFRAVVQYTLNNPFYYGDFLLKGKLYKGIHEPLITRECWEKVQEVLADRRKKKLRNPRKREAFAFGRYNIAVSDTLSDTTRSPCVRLGDSNQLLGPANDFV